MGETRIEFREQSKQVVATVSVTDEANNEDEDEAVLARAKKLAEKAMFMAHKMK